MTNVGTIRTKRFYAKHFGAACVLCGSNDKLETDHIVALGLGGSDTSDNIQVLCRPCHIVKTRSDNSQISLLQHSYRSSVEAKAIRDKISNTLKTRSQEQLDAVNAKMAATRALWSEDKQELIRQKLSDSAKAALTGRVLSEDARAVYKQAWANTGEEAKRSRITPMHTALKGVPKTEAHKEKLRQANVGKTLDPLTRSKISEKLRGRTVEQRAATAEKKRETRRYHAMLALAGIK